MRPNLRGVDRGASAAVGICAGPDQLPDRLVVAREYRPGPALLRVDGA